MHSQPGGQLHEQHSWQQIAALRLHVVSRCCMQYVFEAYLLVACRRASRCCAHSPFAVHSQPGGQLHEQHSFAVQSPGCGRRAYQCCAHSPSAVHSQGSGRRAYQCCAHSPSAVHSRRAYQSHELLASAWCWHVAIQRIVQPPSVLPTAESDCHGALSGDCSGKRPT